MADDDSTGWYITADPPEDGGDGDGDCDCQLITYVVAASTAQTGQLQVQERDVPPTVPVNAVPQVITNWPNDLDLGGAVVDPVAGTITGLNRSVLDISAALVLSYTGRIQQEVLLELHDGADILADARVTVGHRSTPSIFPFGGNVQFASIPALLRTNGDSTATVFNLLASSALQRLPEDAEIIGVEIFRDNDTDEITWSLVDGADVQIGAPMVQGVGIQSVGFTQSILLTAGTEVALRCLSSGGASGPNLVTAQVYWVRRHTKRVSVAMEGTGLAGPGLQVYDLRASVVSGGSSAVSILSATFKAAERQPPLITEDKSVCVCEGPGGCPVPEAAFIVLPTTEVVPAPAPVAPGLAITGVVTFLPAIDETLYTATLLGPAPTSGPTWGGPPGARTSVEFEWTTDAAPSSIRVELTADPEACSFTQPITFVPS